MSQLWISQASHPQKLKAATSRHIPKMRLHTPILPHSRRPLFFLFLIPSFLVIAGPTQRHIESVQPRAGQQGTTVDMTIDGLALQDVKQVIFYRPGIEAIEFQKTEQIASIPLAHGTKVEERVRCKFVIAPDCPVGEHPFKIRTATELTSLSTFWVTRFPIVGGARPTQGDKAQPVPLNSTVSGRQTDGGSDFYRVSCKAGQRLTVEVDSVRLSEVAYATGEFDLTARILDSGGKVLAKNDDNALHIPDPICTVIVPSDGDYLIDVKQAMFQPGNGLGYGYYLAHIGTFPRPMVVFPSGGPAGQPLEVTLLNGAGEDTKQTVKLPEARGDFDFFPEENGLLPPSRLQMRVSDYPNLIEQEQANNTPVGSLPIAINGVISKTREQDTYRLNVKKGDHYRVQVFARVMGTPLDARIWIQHTDSDKPEIEADHIDIGNSYFYSADNSIKRKGLLDPIVEWKPEKDGEYTLGITDIRGSGDRFYAYRIEIEPVRAAIHTYIYPRVIDRMQCPRLTSPAIPQGNRWTMTFSLKEALGNTYKGPLEFYAEGLPQGVEMIAPPLSAGQRSGPVQFVAAPDTPPQASLINVRVRPAGGDVKNFESRCQESFPFVSRSGGHAWHHLITEQYVLAVTEPAPYTIDVEQPLIPLIQNGELGLKVKIARHNGFEGKVDFQAEWLPPGIAGSPAITIEPGQTEAVFNITASGGAPLGKAKLALISTTDGTYSGYYTGVGRMRVSTRFIDIEVAEPHLSLSSQPSAIRRGERTEFVWRIENKRPFSGEADAVMTGLPRGVEVVDPRPKIKAGQAELIFYLAANHEALLGHYRDLKCEVLVPEGDQKIRQHVGRGALRVDPALKQ